MKKLICPNTGEGWIATAHCPLVPFPTNQGFIPFLLRLWLLLLLLCFVSTRMEVNKLLYLLCLWFKPKWPTNNFYFFPKWNQRQLPRQENVWKLEQVKSNRNPRCGCLYLFIYYYYFFCMFAHLCGVSVCEQCASKCLLNVLSEMLLGAPLQYVFLLSSSPVTPFLAMFVVRLLAFNSSLLFPARLSTLVIIKALCPN